MIGLSASEKTVPEFTICLLCQGKLGMRPAYTMNGHTICAGCYKKVFWLRRLHDLVEEPVPPGFEAVINSIAERKR